MGVDEHGDPRRYRNLRPGHAADAAVDRLEHPARRDPPGRLRGGEDRGVRAWRAAVRRRVDPVPSQRGPPARRADASFVRKGILFWISRLARVPVVVHMHGSGFQEYYENSPRAIQAVIRATLCRASAVVALGEVWAARLRVIAPTARITVIPNAVRPARRTAQPAPGEPVHVVFLGRIGDRKGTFRLLDAWAELARDPDFGAGPGKAATLTIAGDGEVERARHRIRELRLEDTVEVREWLSESDVGELLDHSQVLVLPSRNEGQPMAVLEAMARGLCVIASDVGGLPEMIGGGCGVIVSPDDIEAIAAALRLVVHDHELRARYGAAAYARVEDQFDVRTVWRRLDALYREVSR